MLGIALATALALGGASPSPSPSPTGRHLEYRFAWNAKLSDTGPHTGTLTVNLQPPAADGSVVASASELWWNDTRPSDLDTCQIGADGGVACTQRPYSLSSIDLALFPLLGVNFFDPLAPGGVSTWKRSFELTKGLSIWDCTFTLNSSGPIAGSPPLVLIEVTGAIVPHGGHYREETVNVTSRVAYDPTAKLPVMIYTELVHSRNQPRSLESVQMELKSGAP